MLKSKIKDPVILKPSEKVYLRNSGCLCFGGDFVKNVIGTVEVCSGKGVDKLYIKSLRAEPYLTFLKEDFIISSEDYDKILKLYTFSKFHWKEEFLELLLKTTTLTRRKALNFMTYTLAYYMEEDKELLLDLWFSVFNVSKTCKDARDVRFFEIGDIPEKLGFNFAGMKPKKSKYLGRPDTEKLTISEKDIVITEAQADKLTSLLEDYIYTLEDDNTIEILKTVAAEIGLKVCEEETEESELVEKDVLNKKEEKDALFTPCSKELKIVAVPSAKEEDEDWFYF